MKQTGRIALGGILGALALTFLLLTVFPFGTYALPAIAGAVFIPLVVEFGAKSGFLTYAAVSFVCAFIVPDMEARILFIGFFGYYPVLKALLERLGKRWLEWVIKLAVFNISMVLSYLLLIFVFSLDREEFVLFEVYLPYLFLAVGNGVFLLYDKALTNVVTMYIRILHPRIAKTFRLK